MLKILQVSVGSIITWFSFWVIPRLVALKVVIVCSFDLFLGRPFLPMQSYQKKTSKQRSGYFAESIAGLSSELEYQQKL